MTDADRRAIEGAAAQVVEAMGRTSDALRNLFRALDTATSATPSREQPQAAPSAPPAPAELAAEPEPQAKLRRTNKNALRFDFKGQQLTIMQLASLAGCGEPVMRYRLLQAKRTAAEAVAMGAADRFRAMAQSGNRTPGPRPKGEKKAKSPAALPVALQIKPKPEVQKLSATQEVIVPANVKRTVAPPIPDRFAVSKAPSTFGRIGQYEDTGSAIARQYGGAR